MTLSRVTRADIGAVCNYIIDELKGLGSRDTRGVSIRIEDAILSNESWKVEDDGVIVAFCCVEHVDVDTGLMVSFYVAPEYRHNKAIYMISKKALEIVRVYSKVVYIPLSGEQWLPKRFCDNKIINTEAWGKVIERFNKRWEVVQKL